MHLRLNLFSLLCISLCVLIVLSGCGGGPTFTLTTTVEGQGSITVNPVQNSYKKGTQVTLTAVPTNEDWEFTKWEGNLSGSNNPTTVTVTSNLAVKAVFQEVNQAPVFEVIGDRTVTEGDTLNFQITAADPNGDTLTYSASGDLTEHFKANNQTFNWETDYTDAGEYFITFTVTDGQYVDEEMITIVVNEKKLRVPQDYETIQEAIDAAEDGMTVVVAPGDYAENLDFKGKAITVQSTDPGNETVVENTRIDGGKLGPVVSFSHGESDGAVLEGLTIKNGKGDAGGIMVTAGSSPVIRNNWIIHNQGAGIYVQQNSAPTISHNLISENVAMNGGGISVKDLSSPAITNNTISKNVASGDGGGIYLADSIGVIITENVISENGVFGDGGGIAAVDAEAQIADNHILLNIGVTGGGICAKNSNLTISNNLIKDNDASNGGGISTDTTSCNIKGNTIQDNHTWGSGGGLYLQKCSSVVEENAIKTNEAKSGGGIQMSESTPIIRNNVIEANVGTENAAGICVASSSSSVIYGNTITDHANTGIYVGLTSTVQREDGTYWPRENSTTGEATNTYANNTPYDVFFLKIIVLGEGE